MDKPSAQKPFEIKAYQIALPVLIGLGVVLAMFWREFFPKSGDSEVLLALQNIRFTWRTAVFIVVAFLFMFGRDIGYMARLRVLSDDKLTWRQCFRVIMLWEFTSAITPSAVGGTSVAILYVAKEGVSVGKSSAIVMMTSLLDEIYFVVMFPLLLLLIPEGVLFDIPSHSIATGLLTVTIIGYGIKFVWVFLMIYGLFINPQGLRWLIIKVFSLPLLRRWKGSVGKVGDDIVTSAQELRHKGVGFWAKGLLATFLSWTSRYWVVNALFVALLAVHLSASEHFIIFARQLVMWIMMLVSPTPGGSGFAEWVFKEFLGDFIQPIGLVIVIALLWRLVSYYLYLIIGAVMVPKWLNDKFTLRKKKHQS
jgi:uncharacterized membrane protein YbhN (UPF0104 family)